MRKTLILGLSLAALYSGIALAANPGDVVFVNDNPSKYSSQDTVRFEVINEAGLSWQSPNIAAGSTATLNFKDTATTQFRWIYIQDITKNGKKIKCLQDVGYSREKVNILTGANNGTSFSCEFRQS